MAEVQGARRTRRRSGRRVRARRARMQQLAALLVAATLAAALLALAVPRSVALVLMMPAERTLSQLRRQLPVDPAAVNAAIETGLAASRWVDSGTLWQQIARAHLGRLQVAAADRTTQVEALLQAEASLQRALARRPGNPFVWWRLAVVANTLGRPSDQVATALQLSLLTGSRADSLLFPRLRLALANWAHLGTAARQAFTRELARAMRRDPEAFITLVRRSLAEEHVRAAFNGERDLLDTFQALIDRTRPLPGGRQS